MSFTAGAIRAFESTPMPDAVARLAIRALVANHARILEQADRSAVRAFAQATSNKPIAPDTAAANTQHYELPSEFFGLVLGPQRKYSCCYYDRPDMSLAEAEQRALDITARNAELQDGQNILELGCGWGSLTIWMAERMPSARILAVSNSQTQRAYIEQQITRLGLSNVRVTTADMNSFSVQEQFDRIVSVEMFEHMSNWRALLSRLRGWLTPDGRLMIHVFAHETTPYVFDADDKSNWIAQHYFTGGIMPSRSLIREFGELFEVEEEWRWNGTHYARTAQDWLCNFDANRDRVRTVLDPRYGADLDLWLKRWRLFFLATAGLFGYRGGTKWGVSQYRLRAC